MFINSIYPKWLSYKSLIITKNKEYNIIENCWWLLSNNFMDNLINRFTLMESMLLMDGLICGIIFIKSFLIFKVKAKNISQKLLVNLNKDIVTSYNSIYTLCLIDRYTYYFIIYCLYNCHEQFKYSYLILLLTTLPQIQNYLLSIHFIHNILNNYIRNKDIFIKYSISKITLHFIQQLHPQIDKIQNYHIFIIYNNLTFPFILNIIHNCLFILLLNILRSYKSTYYYYKAIKLAYMHSTGYLYNIIPLDNAIYLANIIIKEKRWKEFEKIDIVNGFFVLVVNKYNLLSNINIPLFITSQIILFKISSLWAFVTLFKTVLQLQLVSNIHICFFLLFLFTYLAKCNIKNIITSLIVYFLLIFNTNDLIITSVIISNKALYYCIEEVFFFIKNIKDIKKVIKRYNQISIDEYDIIN